MRTNKNIPANGTARKRRNVFFYAGVIIIPLLFFLLFGEIVMRFLIVPQTIPAPPPPAAIDPYQPNPYIVQTRPFLYFHIPHAVYTQSRAGYKVRYAINSRGFRGPEIIVPKTKGLKRLVVIGDSIVEGHGNEFSKTFPSLLNEHFQKKGWEVINAGVQGASPVYFAANKERYILLQPDAVLIMLFENDIREDRMRESSYFQLPYFDDTNSILNPSSTKRPTLSYFNLALTRLYRNFIPSPMERLILSNRNHLERNKKLQPVPGQDFLLPSSLLDQHWNMTQSYLDRLASFFQQHNVQILITDLSLKALRPDSNASYHTYARAVDEHVSAWAQKKNVPYLSLLPVIRQAFQEQEPAQVMIQGDGHPTNDTQARIKAALRPWLEQHLTQERNLDL
jgi:lysophospholipase L1-like esterase